MARSRALALAGVLTAAAALSVSGFAVARAGYTPHVMYSPAQADALAFLRTYVQPNGQVIRHGDGGDTVSEGQAYALLLAQVADQPSTFARVWRWTAAHLQQRSGLLAWQASASGRIESAEPASDADLLSAWALSREAGAGAAPYRTQARRMAKAILAGEVVKHGPTLLAAGPWATGSPASLDPSYWAPAVFNALAEFTGNREWAALAANATRYTQQLTNFGRLLPPDWAHLEGSEAIANPAPNRSAPTVQYGLDAQRLTVWMATSCQPANRNLAASWWKLLSNPSAAGAEALDPNGTVLSAKTSALGYVAAAAAAQAAGDTHAVTSLLKAANTSEHRAPDYYSAAWLALGEALLTTDSLGGCR